jgi:DMSO/TMAO reductase YedYZ molybdopterin-dependent catalytic subunit
MATLLPWKATFLALVAAALAVGLCSCGVKGREMTNASPAKEPPAGPKEVAATPKELPAVEVREYKGQNLSSVKDFRENSIKGPQKVDKATYRLEITGLVTKPLSLTYDEVIDREKFSKVVTLDCVEGWSATILWEGVKVKDLLAQAGYDPKAAVVIFTAYDGYTTSHPVSWLLDKDILLAYRMNGIDVPVERGFPFVLVAEDKWGYKWIKWVTKMEVSHDTAFRGTWESRGYNQNGDVSGPMFAPRP